MLFVLGLFGLLVINAKVIANEVKENFAITILLSNEAPEVEVRQFQKSLELTPYVKTTEFISKEEAAEELRQELAEDFMEFLGYNPLLNSIEVKLKADYVNEEQLTFLEKEYGKEEFVKEVVYDKPLIQMMNENIERIGIFLIAGSVLLLLIAIALINSSIRLSIYSRRFLIKTMQLVGATKSFIRQPFIWRSLRHGVFGALVALAFLSVLIYYVSMNIPGFTELQDPIKLGALYGGIILIGILISMSCTFFALRKYLKLTTDQLYY